MPNTNIEKTMLVLHRRPGETVLIGDDVEVSVSGVRGNQVKLTFRAPREIPIVRTELLTKSTHSQSSLDQT
ncbi:MAG: carbon storage regulator [Candidatus Sedimenticola endophacoides]